MFSKHREGRFPETDEILDALRALAGADQPTGAAGREPA